MDNNQKFLENLKNELEEYAQQLIRIQKEFKGATGTDYEKINESLKNIYHEAVIAYGKLEAASAAEWEPLKERTNEIFMDLRNSFKEKMDSSVYQIKEYKEQLEESWQTHVDNLAAYVREHPVRSLLCAFGVGFIIGKMRK